MNPLPVRIEACPECNWRAGGTSREFIQFPSLLCTPVCLEADTWRGTLVLPYTAVSPAPGTLTAWNEWLLQTPGGQKAE